MADIEYQASLDDGDILKTLKNIDKNISGLAQKGDKNFKSISNSAKVSGVQIGAVAGVVQELTSRFIELGVEAIRQFANITAGGVELNKNLETAGRVFGAAFGDPNLGQATLDFLKDVSEQLNVDRGEATAFAQSILPKTGSLDEFTDLLRLTDIQADATGQTISDLEFSIREALSGDFVSLKDRFDIGKEQIQQIKDLTPEVGRAQAIIQVLNEDFERLGKVNIQGTLATDIKGVQAQATELQRVFGESTFEELKELFTELGGILDERGDDFELIAQAFGNVVANVVDFIGSGITDFLENIDTEEVIALAENLFDMVESARSLVEVLGLLELPGDLIPAINTVVEGLDKAITTAIQLTALAKAQAAKARAEAEATQQFASDEDIASSFLGGFQTFELSDNQQAQVATAGQEAYNAALQKSLDILDKSKKKKDENKESIEEHRKALEEDTSAQDAANKAAIEAKLRQQVLLDAIKAGQAAQETIDAENEELAEKHQEKLFDIQKKATERRLEDEIKASEKRADIARKDAEKIEDIHRKNEQAIADAGVDLSRKEEDIARKQARERADLDKDNAKERVTIEEDFQKEIQAIKTRFAQNALDAERGRDALAFIAAQRQAEQEVETAKQSKDEKVSTTKDESAERREELRVSQEREIEDAKIANERKLEDLRTNLERQLQEQQINRQRDEEDLVISLERQEEARQRSLEREIEQANLANERKLAALQEKLAAEFEAVKAAEEAKTQVIEEETTKRIDLVKSLEQQAENASKVFAGPGSLTGPGTIPGFAEGGIVPGSPNQAVPITAHGQEMVLNQSQQASLFGALNRQPSAVPLPPSVSSVSSSVDRSLNVDQLNFGSSMDLIERLTAAEQALEFLARAQ